VQLGRLFFSINLRDLNIVSPNQSGQTFSASPALNTDIHHIGLCLRRDWGEPLYETYMNNSSWVGIVTVDGHTFRTEIPLETEQQAQESVAMQAFLGCQHIAMPTVKLLKSKSHNRSDDHSMSQFYSHLGFELSDAYSSNGSFMDSWQHEKTPSLESGTCSRSSSIRSSCNSSSEDEYLSSSSGRSSYCSISPCISDISETSCSTDSYTSTESSEQQPFIIDLTLDAPDFEKCDWGFDYQYGQGFNSDFDFKLPLEVKVVDDVKKESEVSLICSRCFDKSYLCKGGYPTCDRCKKAGIACSLNE
jgi:hypothetical protein